MKSILLFTSIITFGFGSYAQIITIPDPGFKTALIAHEPTIDTDGNGEISTDEAQVYKGSINVRDKGITNLIGIEKFVNITSLDCSGNLLAELDVGQNLALTSLDCSGNLLAILYVNQNPALISLNCSGNTLASLSVGQNLELKSLDCSYNPLVVLDVSQNHKLISLDCHASQLFRLDLRKTPALTTLDCSRSRLTALDVGKNPALADLDCSDNQLEALDVGQNPALTSLDCSDNQLEALDVGKNPALADLDCSGNQLEALDVGKNPALADLDCSGNQLEALDVSKNPALITLDCSENSLRLNIGKNPALTYLDCSGNLLILLNVSKNPALTYLDCSKSHLIYLSLKNGTNDILTTMKARGNPLLKCIAVDVVPDAGTPVQEGWKKDQTASYCPETFILESVARLPGIDEMEVSLCPNPAWDEIRLNFPSVQNLRAKLLSLDGKTIKDYGAQRGGAVSLGVYGLLPGTYLLQIESSGKTLVRKVTVN